MAFFVKRFMYWFISSTFSVVLIGINYALNKFFICIRIINNKKIKLTKINIKLSSKIPKLFWAVSKV